MAAPGGVCGLEGSTCSAGLWLWPSNGNAPAWQHDRDVHDSKGGASRVLHWPGQAWLGRQLAGNAASRHLVCACRRRSHCRAQPQIRPGGGRAELHPCGKGCLPLPSPQQLAGGGQASRARCERVLWAREGLQGEGHGAGLLSITRRLWACNAGGIQHVEISTALAWPRPCWLPADPRPAAWARVQGSASHLHGQGHDGGLLVLSRLLRALVAGQVLLRTLRLLRAAGRQRAHHAVLLQVCGVQASAQRARRCRQHCHEQARLMRALLRCAARPPCMAAQPRRGSSCSGACAGSASQTLPDTRGVTGLRRPPPQRHGHAGCPALHLWRLAGGPRERRPAAVKLPVQPPPCAWPSARPLPAGQPPAGERLLQLAPGMCILPQRLPARPTPCIRQERAGAGQCTKPGRHQNAHGTLYRPAGAAQGLLTDSTARACEAGTGAGGFQVAHPAGHPAACTHLRQEALLEAAEVHARWLLLLAAGRMLARGCAPVGGACAAPGKRGSLVALRCPGRVCGSGWRVPACTGAVASQAACMWDLSLPHGALEGSAGDGGSYLQVPAQVESAVGVHVGSLLPCSAPRGSP